MAMHFDLTDMQLMVHISEVNSLTKGAERSHLSLPAASNRVKNLENNLGTALLYRNSQGVTLTPSGEAFVRHAHIVLRQLEHLRGDIREFAEGIKGKVRVYANTTAMNEFMPDILSRYLALHPDVSVELRERLSYRIVKLVSEGLADIGVVAGIDEDQIASDDGVRFIPYRSDNLVLVTSQNHRLAAYDELAFAETLSYEFVGLSEWSAIHAFLKQAAETLGSPLRFRVEVGGFEAACRMIAANAGIGVIPETAAMRYVANMPLKIIHLSDSWALRRLYVCVRRLEDLPSFAQELVALMQADAGISGEAGCAEEERRLRNLKRGKR
ncbi:DNA-binding transcriptional LysR family regulator [Advenella incenata]|jgi:DNA-binding transcriptional LysR family regulator|uniref:DNA-binding transcriptional LysR family regulator n=1 Tax=Advenella incenata TaxID=267800 RepID=A0A4Q7VDW2_9BURK|nr:LysR substrate-binding domain-containing protein [Advenella incenata]RZT94000.1 DNA-binding transcriptional LysR family regulator [Advenella incenata]